MFINGIISISSNNVIGNNNRLPWFISKEMEFFKYTTQNSICVMGRETFSSLKKPLKDRINIVLTNNSSYAYDQWHKYKLDNLFFYSKQPIGQLLFDFQSFQIYYKKPIFIIGGAQIYTLFEPYISRWYISRIDISEKGDTLYTYFDGESFNNSFFQSRLLVQDDEFCTYQYDLVA